MPADDMLYIADLQAMRTEHYDYLLAEHHRLLAAFQELLADYDRRRQGDMSTLAVYLAKVREYRLLLANHRLARHWAQNPPGV